MNRRVAPATTQPTMLRTGTGFARDAMRFSRPFRGPAMVGVREASHSSDPAATESPGEFRSSVADQSRHSAGWSIGRQCDRQHIFEMNAMDELSHRKGDS